MGYDIFTILLLLILLYLSAYYYQRQIAHEPESFTQFGQTSANASDLQGLLNYYEKPNTCCCSGYKSQPNFYGFTFNLVKT